MRLVIDSNQVDHIANAAVSHEPRPTLVIAPLIWAEIVNGSRDRLDSRLRALRKFDLLFGRDYEDVCTHLRCLNEGQIQGFVPIFPADSREHEILLNAFHSPRREHFERADKLRQDASRDRQDLVSWVQQRKKANRDARSRGEALDIHKSISIEQADSQFISGKNAVLRRCLVAQITEDGTRAIQAASLESLYEAILANPTIRRFLRMKITFDLAYLDQWSSDILNSIGDLQANRNDWPDMQLALFSRDGDTILTNDTRLQTALQHCDPLGKVAISTWADYVQSLL